MEQSASGVRALPESRYQSEGIQRRSFPLYTPAMIDRREFLLQSAVLCLTAVPSAAAFGLPCLGDKVALMRIAMAEHAAAFSFRNAFWSHCELSGAFEQDGFWEMYESHPLVIRWRSTLQTAQESAERVFTTPPADARDEEMVMEGLDAYDKIAGSSFARQTARDLFTPERFQTYPLQNIRKALLTDPADVFEKTGMPEFLRELREAPLQKFLVGAS